MRSALLLSFLTLAACNPSPINPSGADGSVPDLAVSAGDLASPARDLAGPADDLARRPDLIPGPGFPTIEWGKYQVMQNCQPIVSADPVSFFTDMIFTNTTDLPMGPFKISSGSFLDRNGQKLAGFAIDPVPDFTVGARGQQFIHVTKTALSSSPSNACQTLPCNGAVRYVIDWGHTGSAATEHTPSPVVTVNCVY